MTLMCDEQEKSFVRMFYNDQGAKALMKNFIMSIIEANVAMYQEYDALAVPTNEGIKAQVLDYMKDMIGDLEEEVKRKVEEFFAENQLKIVTDRSITVTIPPKN